MRFFVLALAACKSPSVEPTPSDTLPPPDLGFCGELEQSFGAAWCVEAIRNASGFTAGVDLVWMTSTDGSIPPVVLTTDDRVGFLRAAVPDLADVTEEDLPSLTQGESRRFSMGVLSRHEGEAPFTGGVAGYVAFTFEQGDWRASYRDVDDAHDELADLVHPDARFDYPLVFSPDDVQADVVRGWRPNFEVEGWNQDPEAIAYAGPEAVGTVRLLTREAYELGEDQAAFGLGDILVLEDAEGDVERPVAGVISAEPMPVFSGVVQRARRLGTAACYLRDATAQLASFDGDLVRVSCTDEGVTVTTATQTEADTFIAGLQPVDVATVPADAVATALEPLADVDLASSPEGRIGLEATRLARVYQGTSPSIQLRAATIPVSYYLDFLERNTWVVDLGAGPAQHTYGETLDAWLADPAFLDDPAERRTRLQGLSSSMAAAQVDPLLAEGLETLMPTVFGSPLTSLRFRASVNLAEQSELPFIDPYPGASGCVADDRDGDFFGPSACDGADPLEASALQAIARVYAGAWSFEAYELRAFHGVDHAGLVVGVLITDRVVGEQADVVVRSGADGTEIAAQTGSIGAIAGPNTYPERMEVTDRIVRLQGSSEVGRGELVLEDDQVEALLTGVAEVDGVFASVDGELFSEWKLLASGQWAVKQVQPVR